MAVEREKGPWGLVWMVAILAALELGVRVFWTPLYVPPDVFYTFYPGHDYGLDLVRPPCFRDGDEYACFPHEHARIRPHRVPVEKPAGTLRVVTVGSSIGETGYPPFPLALPELLARRCKGTQFQAFDFAAKLFGTRRSAAMLELAQQYAPDIAVVEVSGTNERNDLEADRARAAESTLPWGLVLQSEAVMLGRRFVDNKLELGQGSVDRAMWHQKQGYADPVSQRRWVGEMVKRSRARKQPVVLVARAQMGPRRPHWETVNVRILESFRAKDVTVVDPEKLFPEDPAAERKMFMGDGFHYSQAGHKRVAKAVADAIAYELPTMSTRCPKHPSAMN